MASNSEIADALEEAALSIPDGAERFEKRFGSFIVRCRPTRLAVLDMAKKFRKKLRFTTRSVNLTSHSSVRTYSRAAYNRFVIDGETQNAINYNQASNQPVYFNAGRGNHPNLLIMNVKKVKEGFVVGFAVKGEWNVYHIDTGLTCGCASSDKEGALLKFEGINEEALNQAIEDNKDRSGFQQRALEYAQF